MQDNVIIDTDSYKSCHYLTFPPNTSRMFSYMESRGGQYDRTVFFGLQYLLEEYLTKLIEPWMVKEAESFFKAHGEPFNTDGWNYIAKELKGNIPLKICAVDEGSIIPTHFPLLSAESTDEKTFWVVSWFETMLMRLWYPITVCTQSWHIKQLIKAYLKETADTIDGLPFKLHDFGSRGVSSHESAAIGGAAHLVNFQGSDTCAGVRLANRYYDHPMSGFSIPASEHSSITSWGKAHEVSAYQNMLNQFGKPGSIFACVSDSYDIFNAASVLWGETLKQKVIDSGATVIIRPDSGDPVEVVNKLLYILDGKFGSKVNSKGFRVLNNVRVIQGDGVNEETIKAVLRSAKLAGFSADNLAFGMGGALLQQVNRDTQRFAYKCSEISVKNEAVMTDGKSTMVSYTDIPVYKDPVTDPGKRSKAGRIGTNGGKFEVCPADSSANLLRTKFLNGMMTSRTNLTQIRSNTECQILGT